MYLNFCAVATHEPATASCRFCPGPLSPPGLFIALLSSSMLTGAGSQRLAQAAGVGLLPCDRAVVPSIKDAAFVSEGLQLSMRIILHDCIEACHALHAAMHTTPSLACAESSPVIRRRRASSHLGAFALQRPRIAVIARSV